MTWWKVIMAGWVLAGSSSGGGDGGVGIDRWKQWS